MIKFIQFTKGLLTENSEIIRMQSKGFVGVKIISTDIRRCGYDSVTFIKSAIAFSQLRVSFTRYFVSEWIIENY